MISMGIELEKDMKKMFLRRIHKEKGRICIGFEEPKKEKES